MDKIHITIIWLNHTAVMNHTQQTQRGLVLTFVNVAANKYSRYVRLGCGLHQRSSKASSGNSKSNINILIWIINYVIIFVSTLV